MKKLIQYVPVLPIMEFMEKNPIPKEGVQASIYYEKYAAWSLNHMGIALCEELFSKEVSKYAKKCRRLIVNRVWVWYNK